MTDSVLVLAEEWSGQISGTNEGNLFLQFSSQEFHRLQGVLRINDPVFGINVYDISGTFDGTTLSITGLATQSDANVQSGLITVEGLVQEDGAIVGSWTSTIGTSGRFSMAPNSNINSKAVEIKDTSESLAEPKKPNFFANILQWIFNNVWSVFLMVLAGLLILYFAPMLGLGS